MEGESKYRYSESDTVKYTITYTILVTRNIFSIQQLNSHEN
jgi:hypothetical protein